MKNIKFLIPLFLLLSCSAPYHVTTSKSDKFSDPNEPELIELDHNAFYDYDPLQKYAYPELDAYVKVDRKTKKAIEFGIKIVNTNRRRYILIRENEATFLADTSHIDVKPNFSIFDYKEPASGVFVYYDIGYYPLTKEQFEKIVYAKNLSVRVRGDRGIVDYDNDEIIDSCRKNLKRFYKTEILPRL